MTSKDKYVKAVLDDKAKAKRNLLAEAERVMARPDEITEDGVMIDYRVRRNDKGEKAYVIDSFPDIESNRGYVPNKFHPNEHGRDIHRARNKKKQKMKNRLKRKRIKQKRRAKK